MGKFNFKNKSSKLLTVIITVVVLLALVLAVSSILKCSTVRDKVNEIINPSLSVEIDGETFKGKENILKLPDNGQVICNVRNGGSYRVEVQPNVTTETDFNYSVNDRIYPYSGEDLTASFIDSKQIFSGMFVIDCNQGLDLQSVLSRVWGGAEVSVNVPEGLWLYRLVVTSSDGETVTFLFGGISVIDLSETDIYF